MTFTMNVVAVAALLPVLLAQGSSSPRQLLDLARSLEPSEISIVLKAVQEAIDGKTFRLGPEMSDSPLKVRMGPGGRPKITLMTSTIIGGIVGRVVPEAKTPPSSISFSEDTTTILDYTDVPSRRCDGSTENRDVVIEYTRRGAGGQWTAVARPQSARDPAAWAIFLMLRGADPATSGERRQIGTRWARAIVAPWITPVNSSTVEPALVIGDPIPNVGGERGEPVPADEIQSLWIDTVTLLPLRWEVTKPEPARVLQAQVFNYDSFELQPPAGVDAPACIR